MRALALIAVLAGGCGTRKTLVAVDDPHTPPIVAPAFSATRWVPPNPTYVLTARTVSGAQLAVAATIDAVGVMVGVGAKDLGADLANHIHLNLFKPDVLAQLGVDLQGGIALFSDELDPTLVAHLSAPEQTLAFFDRLRDGGLTTSSVVVDKTEIYTTKLDGNTRLSWAVADDWLWIHLAFGTHDAGTSWFGAHRGAPAWSRDWKWAEAGGGTLAAKGLVGFADLKALTSRLDSRIPAALACTKLLEPVGRIGFAAEAGNGKAAGRISLDLGGAASKIAAAILPPPPGWGAASASAAFGVQWNLDLAAVLAWFAPCTKTFGLDDEVTKVKQLGIRGARAFVETLDLDKKTGRGAVAIEGTSTKLVTEKLDQIPMRSTLESTKAFGSYQGHSISIPFGPTLDYVITDTLAILAVGDTILDAIATGKPAASTPIAAIDITPAKLTVETWRSLLQFVNLPPDRIVGHMMQWQDGHLALAIVGHELVLEARGNRR